jgi:ABC-type uncharacterized transport system substrate-binding protein
MVFVLLYLSLTVLESQTISQIGYIVKKAVPDIENIVVVVDRNDVDKIKEEAKTASLVTRKKYTVFDVLTLGDISKTINRTQKMDKAAMVFIADSKTLNRKSVKYAAHKLARKKIPLVSTREEDTHQGAFMAIFMKSEVLEKHINKKVASALNINLNPEFLGECTIDVE